MSSIDMLAQISPSTLLEANILAGQIRAKLIKDKGIEDLPTISFIENEETADSAKDNARKDRVTSIIAVPEETGLGMSIRRIEMHPSDIVQETNGLIEKARGIPEEAAAGFALMAACGLALKMLHAMGLQDEPTDEELRAVPNFVLDYLKQKRNSVN